MTGEVKIRMEQHNDTADVWTLEHAKVGTVKTA